MPFNFVTRENYDFDFNVIFNVLMQNQIFKKYEHYANRWIQVFQSLNTFDTIPSTTKYFLENSEVEECYQYFFKIQNQRFFLHFNIDEIKKNITSEPQLYPKKKMPLSLFGTEQAFVQYTYEPSQSKKENINVPIILCEFPLKKTHCIVIDGNHRVSALIENGEKTVEVVGCHPMNRKSYMSNVDWAMYLFILEAYYISFRVDKGDNPTELIEKSNVYTTFQSI